MAPRARSARGESAPALKAATQAEHAKHHARTRSAHARELAEDYVEAVAELIDEGGRARVTDLAKRLGVSHVSVVRTVARLQRNGLLETEPYRAIGLTAEGRALAAKVQRRHEIVVRFLIALGVDPAAARSDAEGIEHHVSDATLAAFERHLAGRSGSGTPGKPRTAPGARKRAT